MMPGLKGLKVIIFLCSLSKFFAVPTIPEPLLGHVVITLLCAWTVDKVLLIPLLCGLRKYLYQPRGWSLESPRGWGVLKAKIFFKESMKLNWNFWKGGGVKVIKPSLGEVWILFGTTH